MGIRKEDAEAAAQRKRKRSRTPEHKSDELVTNSESLPKKPKSEDEPAMSGALPVEQTPAPAEAEPAQAAEPAEDTAMETDLTFSKDYDSDSSPQPPAARLRMTVSSGFYVRSLCHDLGLACDSLGLMSSLIRSRQGDYEVGKNVLEYSDLDAGPEVWEPKVQGFLEGFMQEEGWKPGELESEEEWQAREKDIRRERKEDNRERSYKGGRKWKGRGGRNYWKH